MTASVEDQVVEFYSGLFDRIFSTPFRTEIQQVIKRKTVERQIDEAADAASQSLTRFLLNQQFSAVQTQDVLTSFAAIGDYLNLEAISNPRAIPETIVDEIRPRMPCPESVEQSDQGAAYRVALHSVVQVLMLVGPVMAEWQRLNFATTFELPRRVVNRLNQISEQMDALRRANQAAADERYELLYRDYLLQRFHRVEAGTVRMTTNLDVDLRELFVMPRVSASQQPAEQSGDDADEAVALMDLAAARAVFARVRTEAKPGQTPSDGQDDVLTALQQVRRSPRNVIVGAPGGGKSTFFEWLQVKVASVEEEFILGGQQAIPLLLRVRQLDPHNLPIGASLIERATASRDRATLMPAGWLDRQMRDGHVLFMLDGLDETEPELLDQYVLPWLADLLKAYPRCHYLISSRPVGYRPGVLRKLEFTECDLLDFDEPQIREYTCHWCTAVRLAQNEPEGEARREGEVDGRHIADGFDVHPYIRHLARNPLMLSAICLVNYFERGKLPDDRALLYQLCVEGLLHHWDQRRGIHSEFSLDEKLRACREVALAMQSHDRAEYDAADVQRIFSSVLGEAERAARLLQHIRYRTGLLLERRPDIFAFAHLTFQEYLAARAIHEGNQLGVDLTLLVREHNDPRWREVIPLFSALTTAPAARDLVENLIAQEDTNSLGAVLGEAYLAAGTKLSHETDLRRRALERVAVAPVGWIFSGPTPLDRFPPDEVAPITNTALASVRSASGFSHAFTWLQGHPRFIDVERLVARLDRQPIMSNMQVNESQFLLQAYAPDQALHDLAKSGDVLGVAGFLSRIIVEANAMLFLLAMLTRVEANIALGPGFYALLIKFFQTIVEMQMSAESSFGNSILDLAGRLFASLPLRHPAPDDPATAMELARLVREVVNQAELARPGRFTAALRQTVESVDSWAASPATKLMGNNQAPDSGV